MFDINDESLTKVKKDTAIDRMTVDQPTEPDVPDNPLDTDDMQQKHRILMGRYRQELDRQTRNRLEQAIEEDYYDNIQWTEDEKDELKARGQAPLVYNVIAQSVNWIIGSEKRSRTDFKILPRRENEAKAADGKTKILKYLSDVNRSPFHRSRAFEDVTKVGIGWLEDGAQDEDDGEILYSRYESWRNMLWDSAATEMDLSDCRYVFRSKWVDEDVAIALAPERKDVISQAVTDFGFAVTYGEGQDGDRPMDQAEFERETAVGNGTVVNYKRRRVRMVECWYRMPDQVKRLRGGTYSGQILDENDPRHQDELLKGVQVVEKTMMRMRVAIMTSAGMIYDGPSPYRHNRFPFTPIWGFRRGRDGLPYGVIRWMKDIQDDINKRASKALHILSSNKVIMDEGAVDDMDAFADEVGRPDAIIVKKQGKEIVLNADRELAPAHLDLMSRNIQMVQQVGGVTDELLGRSTNAVSGVAVQARQEQGSVATNKLFDNLRLAVQMQGELQLSLVEQFVTEEKQFRITNQRGSPEFVTVNDGLPENDIARTKADFVVSESAWNATMRQSAAQQLTDMMMKMPPQVALVVLDLVVENMDIPNADEIVKRIRAVNGQKDPDNNEMTPEEQAEQQAKDQAAAQQAEMQARAAMAEIAEKEAKVAKTQAEAKRIEKLMIGDGVTAMNTAMQAATAVVQMPTIAKVADELLTESGWNNNVQAAANGLPAPAQPGMQQGMPGMPAQPPEAAQMAPGIQP